MNFLMKFYKLKPITYKAYSFIFYIYSFHRHFKTLIVEKLDKFTFSYSTKWLLKNYKMLFPIQSSLHIPNIFYLY